MDFEEAQREQEEQRRHVLESMARAQRHKESKSQVKTLTGWVPSGLWRVYWKLALLLGSTADVTLCTSSLAFCKTFQHLEDIELTTLQIEYFYNE